MLLKYYIKIHTNPKKFEEEEEETYLKPEGLENCHHNSWEPWFKSRNEARN